MESAWQCRKRTVDESIAPATSLASKKPRPELSFQDQLEECYALRCLCSLPSADLHAYLNKFAQSEDATAVDNEEQLLLGASCLAWIGESCHQQLVAGRICPALQAVVAGILSDDAPVFFRLLPLIKVPVPGTAGTFSLKILSSQKRGGYKGVPFEPFRLPTPSLMFFLNT
jgi:hypothetical protein